MVEANTTAPAAPLSHREVSTTDVYPTRYAAFDRPGTWVLFAADADGMYRSCTEDSPRRPRSDLGAGISYPGEMAVLHIPQQNEVFDLVDGTYVEIGGNERMGFTVECRHTYPTRQRSQKSWHFTAGTLAAAIACADEWISQL